MSYPHGDDCRCPELPSDAGLLAYTVDCDHYAQLAAVLRAMRPTPPPARAVARLPEPEPEPIDISPRRQIRQPWEVRPARKRAA